MNGGKAAVHVLLVAASRVESGVFIRLLHELAPGRFVVWRASNLHFARRLLDEAPIDVLVVDLDVGGRVRLAPLHRARRLAGDRPVVVRVDASHELLARRAVELGASGYLLKVASVVPDAVRVLLDAAATRARARGRVGFGAPAGPPGL